MEYFIKVTSEEGIKRKCYYIYSLQYVKNISISCVCVCARLNHVWLAETYQTADGRIRTSPPRLPLRGSWEEASQCDFHHPASQCPSGHQSPRPLLPQADVSLSSPSSCPCSPLHIGLLASQHFPDAENCCGRKTSVGEEPGEKRRGDRSEVKLKPHSWLNYQFYMKRDICVFD